MVHQFIRLCVIGIGLGGALSSTWGMEKNSYPSIPQSIGSKVGQDNFKGSIIDFLSQKKQEAFLDEKGFKIEGRNIVKKTTNESLSLLELRSLSPDSYNSWLASKQQALQKQLEGSVLALGKVIDTLGSNLQEFNKTMVKLYTDNQLKIPVYLKGEQDQINDQKKQFDLILKQDQLTVDKIRQNQQSKDKQQLEQVQAEAEKLLQTIASKYQQFIHKTSDLINQIDQEHQKRVVLFQKNQNLIEQIKKASKRNNLLTTFVPV